MAGWKKDGMSSRGSCHIKCPFFIAHSAMEIMCESHMPDSKIIIRFSSEKKKSDQQHIYCEGCFKRCEHYIAVNHFKWPDE